MKMKTLRRIMNALGILLIAEGIWILAGSYAPLMGIVPLVLGCFVLVMQVVNKRISP